MNRRTLGAVRLLMEKFPRHYAQIENRLKSAVKKLGIGVKTFERAVKREEVSTGITSLSAPLLASRYQKSEAGFVWFRPGNSGIQNVRLTNFTAAIVEEVVTIGGLREQAQWRIEAIVEGRTSSFLIEPDAFAKMSWPAEFLGPRALVFPGQSVKDHLRFAIQVSSPTVRRRVVYAATGWWMHDEQWIYVHAGGGIDGGGLRDDVNVDISRELAGFVLPNPLSPEELKEAVK